MSVTTGMRAYLENIAEWLINDADGVEEENLRRERARLWREMTEDERNHLNGLVEDIFGQWM